MYPVLVRLGSFDVTSFGLLVGVGALAGLHIFGHELHRRDLPAGTVNAAIGGLMFGLAGAKLLWVLEHVSEGPFLFLVLSRGGMSWFGGFAGGVGAGLLFLRLARVPLVPALAAAAPALAMGQAIGRVGCFLVGDDYGQPTDLPWGVAFPHGSPPIDVHVHPTQLYEAALLIGIWYLLTRWGRAHVDDRRIVAGYLTMVGTVRFAIEFIRVNARVLGPFTIAHFASMAAIGTGVALIVVNPR